MFICLVITGLTEGVRHGDKHGRHRKDRHKTDRHRSDKHRDSRKISRSWKGKALFIIVIFYYSLNIK